jgi:hypothetical protein
MSGCYDTFKKRLGYRLYASSLALSVGAWGCLNATNASGQPYSFTVQITNAGWAAPVKNRPVELALLSNLEKNYAAAVIDGSYAEWGAAGSCGVSASGCLDDAQGDQGAAIADLKAVRCIDDSERVRRCYKSAGAGARLSCLYWSGCEAVVSILERLRGCYKHN